MTEPDVHPVTGSAGLPTAPRTGPVPADLTGDAAWRQFQAQHLAAHTLALQRTEWYAKSIRISGAVLAVLAVAGLILGLVLGLTAGSDAPTTLYGH